MYRHGFCKGSYVLEIGMLCTGMKGFQGLYVLEIEILYTGMEVLRDGVS